MLELPFTHRPGWRERQLKRRHGNPLFAWPPESIDPEALLDAQRADHEEMEEFRISFRALVQRAVDLPPSAGSDEILELKEALERHYEQSFGLPTDLAEERRALARLIDLTMKAVRLAAGHDPVAQRELEEEEAARAVHRRLLTHPLVSDLLRPDSPIGTEALAPSLLSAAPAELEAALELFDGEQIAQIASQAARLADERAAQGADMSQVVERLSVILDHLHSQYPQQH